MANEDFDKVAKEYAKMADRIRYQEQKDEEFRRWLSLVQNKGLKPKEPQMLADRSGHMQDAEALLQGMVNEAWQGEAAAAYNDMRYFLTSMVSLTVTTVRVYNKQFRDAIFVDPLKALGTLIQTGAGYAGHAISKTSGAQFLRECFETETRTFAPAMTYSLKFDPATNKVECGNLERADGKPFTDDPTFNQNLQSSYETYVDKWLKANGYKPDPANTPGGYINAKTNTPLDQTTFDNLKNDAVYGLEAFYKVGAAVGKAPELVQSPTP